MVNYKISLLQRTSILIKKNLPSVSIQSQNPQNPIWEKKNPQIQFHGFLLRRPVPFVFLSRGITYPNPGIYSCGGRALPLLRRPSPPSPFQVQPQRVHAVFNPIGNFGHWFLRYEPSANFGGPSGSAPGTD
jgi:hypothetical protein